MISIVLVTRGKFRFRYNGKTILYNTNSLSEILILKNKFSFFTLFKSEYFVLMNKHALVYELSVLLANEKMKFFLDTEK